MRNPVRRTATKTVYEGNLIQVWQDSVVQPKGTETIYERARVKPGASVLAIDDERRVILVEEFKYAMDRPSIEVVSGGTEPGEDPLVTAQRELREEAGFDASEWIAMGRIDPFTTMLYCPIEMFVARGLTEVGHEREEGEVMEVRRVPAKQAVEWVMDGTITHGTTVALVLKALHAGYLT